MAETKYIPRLKEKYDKEIVKTLMKELDIKNVNQVPKLEKVIVSSGVGKKREDKRFTETVELTIAKITGQATTSRLAKKSIATFKIRKGMGAPIGYLTTLRGAKMYEFVDRLINIALPHVRDFSKTVNYNLVKILEKSHGAVTLKEDVNEVEIPEKVGADAASKKAAEEESSEEVKE